MKKDKNRREYNEVVIFLVNLFFLQVLGKLAVTLLMLLLRLFGMEQLVQAYYALPRHGYYTFCFFLALATIVSIVRLTKRQPNR